MRRQPSVFIIYCLLLASVVFSDDRIRITPSNILGDLPGLVQNLREDILLDEGFEGTISGWAYIDNNNDGETWGIFEDVNAARTGVRGAGIFTNGVVSDDYFIFPSIDLPANQGIELSFWSRSMSASYPESFNVKVSTSGDAASDYILLESVTNVPESWTQYIVDITAYAGQTVSLAIHNISNSMYYQFVDDIQVTANDIGTSPTANFSASPTSGEAPLVVQFTDLSEGDPSSWSWSFGDGGTSNLQSPSHTFASNGEYSIELTVTNDFGSSSELKSNYITVQTQDGPVAQSPQFGDGTESNPYQISTLANLYWMAVEAYGAAHGCYFVQTQSIDASATRNWSHPGLDNYYGFLPIHFIDGSYDGAGFTIDGLYVDNSGYVDPAYAGLFSLIQNSSLTNLNVTNVDIIGNTHGAGGVVAMVYYDGVVSNCSSTGSVRGSGGVGSVGGVIGATLSSADITNCHFEGYVEGTSNVGGLIGHTTYGLNIDSCTSSGTVVGNDHVGGLVGYLSSSLSNSSSSANVSGTGDIIGGLVGFKGSFPVNNCFSTGNVSGVNSVGGLVGETGGSTIHESLSTGIVTGVDRVGGLVGYNNQYSDVYNCYSTAQVTGSDKVGGLVGYNYFRSDIFNAYSTGTVIGVTDVGGFVGQDQFYTSINNCFWDTLTSGQGESAGGIGKATVEMNSQATFTEVDWSFKTPDEDGIWNIGNDRNSGYPYLNWEYPNDPSPVSITNFHQPNTYRLIQNYPNPFNPSTTIRYGLPEEANVSLVIYDVRGQVVQAIASEHQSAGWYDVVWNGHTAEGKTISTGIYFARLVAGDHSQVIKMLYLE